VRTSIGGILGNTSNKPFGDIFSGIFTKGTYSVNSGTPTVGGFVGTSSGSRVQIKNSYTYSTLVANNVTGGSLYGSSPTGALIQTSIVAVPSITVTNGSGTTIFGVYSSAGSANNSYVYTYGGTASYNVGSITALTSYSTVKTQSFFTNLSFTSAGSSTGWIMPTDNPLSPGNVLNPVLSYQCNTNGIKC